MSTTIVSLLNKEVGFWYINVMCRFSFQINSKNILEMKITMAI